MNKHLKTLFFLTLLFLTKAMFAQQSFTVQGDGNKYYPVTFYDGGYNSNLPVELEIGRSSVHAPNGQWWGSIMATFRFHINGFGHGANFIDADIKQLYANPNTTIGLVGGWMDLTHGSTISRIAIWLRGATTYYYKSNYSVGPIVYDGVANPVPFKVTDNLTLTVKTVPEPYVNIQGLSYSNSAYFNGGGKNYFAGTVGIGTFNTSEFRLAVNGAIGAKRVKVTQDGWADFVFDSDYKLPGLTEVETYIQQHKHLPDVPSAAEVTKNGLDLGEMNKILLQKIEELTLHLIKQEKVIQEQGKRLAELEKKPR
ncbi:hypothetical protein [Chitinophaga rhizophila]|uniref:Uncharacterized protein n=1 Tax=Chitinophaga rhizophila TaxID=2866212 RepID=A0ABS7GM04_9BACT|nr:hypothetical protein [Chitinophaga rhizophila]MBW8687899.1 hypothetical protein [Chitinophaga rhizophila]